MLEQLAVIDGLLDEADAGGGPAAVERMRSRGKLPIRERIANVLDPDSPFLEISALAGYGSDYTIGGGMVVGIGVIAGVECVVMGNDPSVLGGALTPYAIKKWMRASRSPATTGSRLISFVESAGADLRVETGGGGGTEVAAAGRQTEHFAESGRALLRDDRALQARDPHRVRGVRFVDRRRRLPARHLRLRDRDRGAVEDLPRRPPLVKMATGEESDDETLGGAQLHAEVSGLGDYLADDEMDAIRLCREVVSHLNWRKRGPRPTAPSRTRSTTPRSCSGWSAATCASRSTCET